MKIILVLALAFNLANAEQFKNFDDKKDDNKKEDGHDEARAKQLPNGAFFESSITEHRLTKLPGKSAPYECVITTYTSPGVAEATEKAGRIFENREGDPVPSIKPAVEKDGVQWFVTRAEGKFMVEARDKNNKTIMINTTVDGFPMGAQLTDKNQIFTCNPPAEALKAACENAQSNDKKLNPNSNKYGMSKKHFLTPNSGAYGESMHMDELLIPDSKKYGITEQLLTPDSKVYGAWLELRKVEPKEYQDELKKLLDKASLRKYNRILKSGDNEALKKFVDEFVEKQRIMNDHIYDSRGLYKELFQENSQNKAATDLIKQYGPLVYEVYKAIVTGQEKPSK